MKLFIVALICLSQLSNVLASSGDRSDAFQHCVNVANEHYCHGPKSERLPLSLRLTRWSCLDDWKYRCTHAITREDIQSGRRIQQFYGKWPFWRLWGMQEPASVAFSLLNMWFHIQGALRFKREVPATHPMKKYYLVWSITSINAWIWSSVFHTRGQFTGFQCVRVLSSQ